ncbi:hypothetical protein HK105_208947 [Polyrhizophydium stewartii]|uniref:Smr domain-containing protein n=1 Tax=Polyrhizophydium stewartii TaxID=2732419 RepID=A0ABR4MWG1_9FUNG
MRDASDRAARLQLAANAAKHRRDPNVLDLHKLTVAEARRAAAEFAALWAAAPRTARTLKVIVGAGHHSEAGPRLKAAVSAHLVRLGWRVEPGGNGWFYLRP